jgi:hypothetical protein
MLVGEMNTEDEYIKENSLTKVYEKRGERYSIVFSAGERYSTCVKTSKV